MNDPYIGELVMTYFINREAYLLGIVSKKMNSQRDRLYAIEWFYKSPMLSATSSLRLGEGVYDRETIQENILRFNEWKAKHG